MGVAAGAKYVLPPELLAVFRIHGSKLTAPTARDHLKWWNPSHPPFCWKGRHDRQESQLTLSTVVLFLAIFVEQSPALASTDEEN